MPTSSPLPRGVVIDEEAAAEATDFFEKVLVHTKGRWASRPFWLPDWQRAAIRQIFGALRPDGLRTYRTVYRERGRKNGKSEEAAGVALKMLIADHEQGAEVCIAAVDREQAGIIFRMAANMVRRWL